MAKTKQNKGADRKISSPKEFKNWQAILVIVGFIAFFFRDILLQKAFFWEDFIYQYYPFRNFAAASMANGELPLWNPYTFNGYPFQADIQSAIFYIPNLLLTFFVSGGRLHFFWLELQIVLHYMIAGVTMYYLARSYEIKRNYALFSGLVFALSGFIITRAIHHTIICEAAWLPLIVLLFKKTLEKRSWRMMLLTAFVLGQTVLAGFPQMSLYIFLLLFFMFVYEFTVGVKGEGLNKALFLMPLAAGVVVLALACSAIQLLPTAELAPYSQRAELSYEKSLYGSLSWSNLIILVVPKFLGVSGAQGSTFWGEGEYGQFWETCFYIGIAGLICATFAVVLARRQRFVMFYAGVAVFSLLYALGDNFILHKLFYNFVPAFNKFRIPGRLSFLFTISAALLSGAGLQYLVEKIESSTKIVRRMLIVSVVVGLALWAFVQGGLLQPTNDLRTYQMVHDLTTSETTTSVVLIVAVCGVIFARLKGVLSAFTMIILLIIIQFVDINVFGFNQNNGATNPDDYFARNAQVATMVKEEGKKEIFRVNSRSSSAMLLDRNQGMIDRIFLMEGYTPLALQRTYPPGRSWEQVCDMLNAKYRVVVDREQRTMSLAASATYLPRAYVVFDARAFEGENAAKKFMESDAFDPHRMIVFEEKPPIVPGDTGYTTEWSAQVTNYRLNTISINVTLPKSGYLVLSEMYYPGWAGYVDGKPKKIYRVNWNFRATPLAAGSHNVEVRYEPVGFYKGLWISAISSIMCVAGFFYRPRPTVSVQQKEES